MRLAMSAMEVSSYPFSANSSMAVSRISCRRTSGGLDIRAIVLTSAPVYHVSENKSMTFIHS